MVSISGPLAMCGKPTSRKERSEEHTSELQSRGHLVCRLLLEKKNIIEHDMTKHLQSRDGKGRIGHGPPGGSSSSSGYYLLGPGASGRHACPHILPFPHKIARR